MFPTFLAGVPAVSGVPDVAVVGVPAVVGVSAVTGVRTLANVPTVVKMCLFAHFMAAGSEMFLIRIHTGNQTGYPM